MIDRRSQLRRKRSYRIFWNHDEVQCVGVTLDICPGGIFVVTCMQLPETSQLDLEIWSGDSVSPLRCRGEVVWVNRGEIVTFPPGFGLKFIEMEPETAALLIQWCIGDDDPDLTQSAIRL